jgi:hypothetical protein
MPVWRAMFIRLMNIARSIQFETRVIAAGYIMPMNRRMVWMAFKGNSTGKQEESS